MEFKYLVYGCHLIVLSAFVTLIYLLYPLNVAGYVVFLFLIFLWFPIKHPCDYNSYSDWLKDYKNWFKKD